MLNLTNLRNLLSQVLSFPSIHTVALFTPQGHLVSFAGDPHKPKDHVRVVVGLSSEAWQETKDQGIGMIESELGRLLVLPVGQSRPAGESGGDVPDPVMLLALNAEKSVSWKELETKARELGRHLENPVSALRGRLAAAPSPINPRPERATRNMTS
ncbi:hypothetical protein WOLCODRAFT_113183 [Wolfiporia cocos MD-104 SS10]|uniref:Roadblock/LAMTOR2 domain-containing protein n=1 Tax=Wolfiporia cocos (strain MD-104) TaxID=742152 RepID=A0A2H3J8Z2_WOLCO|nr:hypothetical protein WOLCODRAFT_113183 [Wolfiporia cocos MD-104 SS10]